jgi:hypothetical protein
LIHIEIENLVAEVYLKILSQENHFLAFGIYSKRREIFKVWVFIKVLFLNLTFQATVATVGLPEI